MIIDFCEKYDMLPRGAKVLAAVSGGKDSVYLLEKLLELAPVLELEVCAAHFDHCLRGAESDRDREFVSGLCEARGVPCYIGRGDVAAYAERNGLGIEEAARVLRYEFLEKTADEIGALRIATAHTADDNLETMMMNLLRGSGLKGLCGIPPVRGRIVRPLLETTAAEILEYLHGHGIEFVEDSTNFEDGCTRNRVRHKLIPLLRELEPSADQAALRCASLLRQDEEFLEKLASDFLAEQKDGISVKALSALPGPVASRALRLAVGRDLSLSHTQALLKLANSPDPHGEADIPGLKVRREYDRLVFGPSGEVPEVEERQLVPGVPLCFEALKLEVRSEFIACKQEINNSDNTFFVKSDSICGNILVGPAKGGEEIRLRGRGCTKTVKKLFQEAKIPKARRAEYLALRDDEGLAALRGFGAAERCAARPGDDVLRISFRQTENTNK